MTDVAGKLWGFCHILRHDGVDYGDYIEQITYLLFIKMADEKDIQLPKGCGWQQLEKLSGTELSDGYVDILRTLGKQKGMLGDIFAGAQSRFSNPVNLKKLIGVIDETEWTSLGVDVKAEAFEGLLEKAASEGKKGAGQYFTPRILIQSIVRCMAPDPRGRREFGICDPACGTGGFLLAAHDYLAGHNALDRDQQYHLRHQALHGWEIVDNAARLCVMNLYLHGVGAMGNGDSTNRVADSLAAQINGVDWDAFGVLLPIEAECAGAVIAGETARHDDRPGLYVRGVSDRSRNRACGWPLSGRDVDLRLHCPRAGGKRRGRRRGSGGDHRRPGHGKGLRLRTSRAAVGIARRG